MPGRRDQAPVEGKQVAIFQVGRRLVWSGDTQRQVGIIEQSGFDLLLGVIAEPNVDVRKGGVKATE